MKTLVLLIFGIAATSLLASDPGEVAVEYLKKVGSGNVDLKPGGDTAIRENTSTSKKDSIRDTLKRLGPELKKGAFELSRVNVDGEFAAALVRRTDDFDEAGVEVYAVALIREGEKWKAAPILASFENAVIGYTVGLKGRLSEMEEWMARERVVELEKMISAREDVMREKIRGSVVGEVLEGDDLSMILKGFMDACAKGDRAAMLGHLGGVGRQWPANWREKTMTVNEMANDLKGGGFPTRLLVSEEVNRLIVHEEKSAKEGMITMVCFDPAKVGELGKAEGFFVLHFPFKKDTENLWYMDLPEGLLWGNSELLNEKSVGDDEWSGKFVSEFREKAGYEKIGNMEEVEGVFLKALAASDMSALLRLADVSDKGSDAIRDFEATARMWWMMNKPGVSRMPMRLGILEKDNFAVVAYQVFSLGRAELYDFQSFVFRNDGEGWQWSPVGMEGLGDEEKKITEEWVKENEGGWKKGWQSLLLAGLKKVEVLPSEGAVDDEEVERFISGWLEMLRGKDVKNILDKTAYLGMEDGLPMRAFRSLFYDLGNVQRAETQLMGIYREGGWLAAGVRYDQGQKIWCSFLPLAVTDGGLKVLPELDLIEEKNRNRDFLNKASLDRLAKFCKPGDMDVLRGMYERFKADCEKQDEAE